jgi:hypothetical protein
MFSVSTHAGSLPSDTFDFEISIMDDSLENGEIVFGPESSFLGIDDICSIVQRYVQRTNLSDGSSDSL